MTESPILFRGLIAYPITPLTGSEKLVDHNVLARLVARNAAAGVDGVTVLASSGAGASFDREERRAIVQTAVAAAGDMPVYVAVSSPSTRDVLAFAQDAAGLGAQGLVVTPFSYLPLDDDEVVALLQALSDETPLPICFYNKPVQTQYDLPPAVLTRLMAETNLVAVKEPATRAGRPASRLAELRAAGGPGLSLGVSGDVQILTDLPPTDAWHTGLAALRPDQYVAVWRAARTNTTDAAEHDAEARTELLTLAQALAGSARSMGALHALATLCGIDTEPPRAPQLRAMDRDLAALHTALG
ncbi:dihydrodipicolinate synthase family protein [Cryobacterium roopkundense]|uniref:4-hydroxy-tetrahydrodipicolinate synthase n=1 Tax=Cryobacterium roopkundense TaxID=1001240 RepID=A0A7W9A0I2_9MICO|nr:dihydrodipicolinate synthase family protein [Cryobacterium roopkundense]MBB5643370.1 4-hydroxy-tetrahydrodipicolinate synthase [Cryobacterium roopkundense]